GVGGHDPVLDSVVDHLDEVAAAVRAAVQIPSFGGAADGLPPRRARDIAHAGSERGKDRIEVLHDRVLAADHQAVSTLASPDAAAGAHIDVVHALVGELPCAPDIVDVIRIA